MISKALSRRSLIASLGGAAGLLPIFQVSRGSAQAASPKRLIVLGKANGTRADIFWPQGGNGTDLSTMTLPTLTASLERHKSNITFVRGLCYKSFMRLDGGAHYSNLQWLTGRGGNYTIPESAYTAYDISLDQWLSTQLGKLPLVLGVKTGNRSISYTSFRAAGQPNSVQDDPNVVFNQLFASLNVPAPAMDQMRLERRSIFDVVGKSLDRISTQVSSEDRTKIQSHIDALRGVETQLGQLAAGGVGCGKPTLGNLGVVTQDANIPAVNNAQMDLLTASLACDLARTAILTISHGGGDHTFPWLGPQFLQMSNNVEECGQSNRTLHNLAHFQEPDLEDRAQFILALTWYYEQFALFLDKLKSVPEGNGTMLDNSIVVYFDGLGRGDEHTLSDIPVMIAGSAGGYFKTGKFINLGTEVPHNGLLCEIANAFGFPRTSFGDEDLGGSMPALRA